MTNEERHAQILQLLNEKKSISVHELSSVLLVSGATIRRDLAAMEQAGLLSRSHGGATLLKSTAAETAPIKYEQAMLRERRIIGELASSLIRPNSTIFLDSSETCGAFIPFLKQYNYLSVVTNGLKNALALSQNTTAKIYFASGTITPDTDCCLGSDTVQYFGRFYADYAVFSASGVTEETGATDTSFEQAALKRMMMQNAKVKILLCDHTKLDNTFLCQICSLSDLDYLVTNQNPGYKEITKNGHTCKILFPEETRA